MSKMIPILQKDSESPSPVVLTTKQKVAIHQKKKGNKEIMEIQAIYGRASPSTLLKNREYKRKLQQTNFKSKYDYKLQTIFIF